MGNAPDAENVTVPVAQQQFHSLQGTLVVVGANVRERSGLEVTVDQYHRTALVDLLQVFGSFAAGDQNDAVDIPGQQRLNALLFRVFVLHGVQQDNRIVVAMGLQHNFAGDIGEIGVVNAGNQKTYRVAFSGAQTLCNNTRFVVDPFGFVHHPLDGTGTDAVLLMFSIQYPGDR